jgi:DNA polymerase-3 subunit beta
MKLICKKSDLISGINIVMKAVSSKTTMSILECILIDATEGNIKMTANDMELGIETKVIGEIIEAGSIAIDAKIFSEIVRKLPDNDVIIEVHDETKANITCENAKFNILIKSAEDFSYLPVIEKNNKITISQFSLKEIIRQTSFAINDAEKNKILTGELFEVHGNKLKVVALDKFRIAIRNVELKEEYGDFKVLVPGKSLNEISKILNGGMEDDVNIYFTNNHILFEFDETIVVSRLIESTNYFDTDKMISNDYKTKLTINKKEMADCIDRATLLIKEGDKKPIFLTVKDTEMELSINTFIGSMDESIPISKEGSDIMISFNPKFLIDILRVLDQEQVNIFFTNPKAPCFIRDEENSYIYIVLPVVQ